MIDAFKPVRDLEAAVCEYTGAPFCVAMNSCTSALLLACAWHNRAFFQGVRDPDTGRFNEEIEIPRRTYVGVPMAITLAGYRPIFRDEDWHGWYWLEPLPVVDSARWFSCDMFSTFPPEHSFVCVSFHAQKTLGFEQGGCILHDDPEADAWLRRARFDGRTEGVAPKDDKFTQVGFHCYLSPPVAAGLLWKLSYLPKHNEPLPNPEYPDLSLAPVFK